MPKFLLKKTSEAEIAGLAFVMKPSSDGSRTASAPEITSYVDINTLQILGQNENGNRLIIKPDEHFEKEIDIAQLKWKKSDSSIWKHKDIWEFITVGKFQIEAGLGVFPQISSTPKKGKNRRC